MASLKSIASQAVSLNGGFSMVKKFFGYPFYDSTQKFIAPLSLKAQIQRVKGKSINLSVIFVGLNDFNFNGTSVVTKTQAINTQAAIQHMRDIYGQAPLGIRKIFWTLISVKDAGSYINIADSSEAGDLTDDWNGDNDGIDMFLVQSIGDAAGWSNSRGPCNKDSVCGKTGAIIEIQPNSDNGREFYGVLVAHEVGHYLGLSGGTGDSNLMGSDDDGNGIDLISVDSTDLTASQKSTMRSGCYVKSAL